MTTIHWHRPAVGEHGHDNGNDLRISVYEWGDVAGIEALLRSQLVNQGHEVIDHGGDWTRSDGRPRALFFDVIVTLDGHEPMRWEHGVCEPSEGWLKPIKRDAPTTPTDDRHATEESK